MNTTNVPKCYLLGMESISGGANWHGNSCLHDWHHSHLNFSNGHPSREPHNGHPHSPHSHDPPHRGGACLWWPHQPNRHILCCPCGPHLFLAGLYLHCGLVCWGPAWSPSTPGCGKSCHCGNLLSWGLYSHGRYTGPRWACYDWAQDAPGPLPRDNFLLCVPFRFCLDGFWCTSSKKDGPGPCLLFCWACVEPIGVHLNNSNGDEGLRWSWDQPSQMLRPGHREEASFGMGIGSFGSGRP